MVHLCRLFEEDSPIEFYGHSVGPNPIQTLQIEDEEGMLAVFGDFRLSLKPHLNLKLQGL